MTDIVFREPTIESPKNAHTEFMETLQISTIAFEIESDGSYERVEMLARRALEAAGIHIPEDGGALSMHPIEDGSQTIHVQFYTLEMDVKSE